MIEGPNIVEETENGEPLAVTFTHTCEAANPLEPSISKVEFQRQIGWHTTKISVDGHLGIIAEPIVFSTVLN